MMEDDIGKVIYKLNEEISDKIDKNRKTWGSLIIEDDYYTPFELLTNGFGQVVEFAGSAIWSSENDDREWVDDQCDPIYDHLKKKAFEHINNLNNLMSVWKSDERRNEK